jgi:hypothetical protein
MGIVGRLKSSVVAQASMVIVHILGFVVIAIVEEVAVSAKVRPNSAKEGLLFVWTSAVLS